MPLFVFFSIVVILFVGLGLDVGFAYLSRAQLAKGVDAACLSGIRNLSQGQAQAQTLAQNVFQINYGRPGRDVAAVTPNITFSQDANNNTVLDINATTTINTYFIRVLPGWKTMNVTARAQATRARLIMALVLDRSGSMGTAPPNGSGGGTALPGDVGTFITQFDDNFDSVAMASFGSTASLDVAMGHPFKTKITNAANALQFAGRTFSDGGLQIGYSQIQNTPLLANENVIKVVVFFTDGFANTFQAKFSCSATPMNLGQSDPFGNPVNGPWDYSFMDPSNGNGLSCNSATFVSIDGTTKSINSANQNIWNEGQLRALNTANQIRNSKIIIYSIGLGVPPTINYDFLKQIANDPSASVYNPNQPIGEAIFAPTPADLDTAFQQIASKILLRLTQ